MCAGPVHKYQGVSARGEVMQRGADNAHERRGQWKRDSWMIVMRDRGSRTKTGARKVEGMEKVRVHMKGIEAER